MQIILDALVESLKKQDNCVLSTIVQKSGSAPREAGTKMLIRQDGSIVGTIGGGLLEAMTIKFAPEILSSKKHAFQDFELSNSDATAQGMVCGGEVRVFLEYMDTLDMPQYALYQTAQALKASETDCMMITKISQKHHGRTCKWLCTETDFYGEEDKEVEGIVAQLRENFNRIKFHLYKGREAYMIEPCYAMQRLYIVGAGHVSQQIAMLSKMLGFYTVVIDDREAFANKERFAYAEEVHVIDSYGGLLNEVKILKNSYIVIVSRSHALDQIILQQALHTHAKYIGMIGSKSKKFHVYAELLSEGFTQEDLDEVHCPIGVPINAQTPEEIAISIVAELIKVKRS
ncbi:MAG: XdhC/CoxI family protein [Epsilonproteobacteria bacterium]|nr:XdhC/CoxI family protein [Campylobacterota bacterium]